MKTTAVVIVVVIVIVGALLIPIIRHGLSSREQPTLMEEGIARAARHFATPASMRNARNPIPLTADVLAEARAHWADHCATCHANDGSGNTEIGQRLYPKAPDMRAAGTQGLSDGELYD